VIVVTRPNDTADVHRLLDEAFAGIEMTADRQDLKEEVRANLVARTAELTAEGMPGADAARKAMAELGDVRTIVDSTDSAPSAVTDLRQHRVRARPGFVLRTVLVSAVGVTGLAVLALAAAAGGVPLGAEAVAAFVVAVVAGVITADALRQETTSNHPMPAGRALGYGVGVLLALAGLACGWLYLRDGGVGWIVAGAVPLVVAAGILSYLLTTQTNRHKQWVMRIAEEHAAIGNRFVEDPSAAARFGIYTVVIWLIAIAAFVLLTLTVGWLWSWLAIIAGGVAMMILTARMLFVTSS
jgi:hypothetical protein